MTEIALEQQFKGAMRRLASGVALVTTADADGMRFGIAMTAFMSLCMEPASLLLAINRNASLCAPLLERGRFAVNILAQPQADMCREFVSTPVSERFSSRAWHSCDDDIPRLDDAVACIVCSLGQADPFGSHMVIQGLVEDVELGDGIDPLIYLDGQYGGTTLHQ